MNQTNRALNRILLFVIGIVLLAAGAALVLAVAWPAAGDVWRTLGGQLNDTLVSAAQASPIGDSETSWVIVGALAAIVIVLALIVVVLAKLGGGRSRSVLRTSADDNALGRIVVKDSFAADALTTSLGARSDVLTAKVSAADVKKETVLHVAVTPHRSASPRTVVLEVDRLTSNLEALTGRSMPIYVSLRSGLRSRMATEHRELA